MCTFDWYEYNGGFKQNFFKKLCFDSFKNIERNAKFCYYFFIKFEDTIYILYIAYSYRDCICVYNYICV